MLLSYFFCGKEEGDLRPRSIGIQKSESYKCYAAIGQAECGNIVYNKLRKSDKDEGEKFLVGLNVSLSDSVISLVGELSCGRG